MTEAAKVLKYGPVVARVNSSGDLATLYEVRSKGDGVYSCQCKGWTFNRETPKRCRHTDGLLKAYSKLGQPWGGGPALDVPVAAAPKVLSIQAQIQSEALITANRVIEMARWGTRPQLVAARIEEAIRKFLGPQPVVAAPVLAVQDRGVRVITLDDE